VQLVDDALHHIRSKLLILGEREIASRQIGELVMSELRKLDKIAYIRFASVYRSFSDVDDFNDAIRDLNSSQKKP
jgi:transcriptional repressor NrdR